MVVIIIGILAAIGIPVFLNQRQQAQSRAAQANLRNAATAQQAFFTATGNHTSVKTATGGSGTAPNDLSDAGFREGTPTVTIVDPPAATGSSFCMTATGGGTTWKFADTDEVPVAGGSC